MKRKAISSLLAASVICSAYTAPAFALTADMEPSLSKFNTAERTFFSIQTQQTNASNHFQLMKDTLLSKPANCDKTLLEAWAAIACGIFADNPSSYMYSTKNEDEFGRLKHLCDFQNKFTHDVRKGESYAGSLYQLLSSPSGTYQHTDDAVLSSAKYRENVITSSTGLQSASNLNQVQEEAFRQLHGLNDGYDTTPQKFKQYHEIKTMTDTAKDGTPALYSMMATRERVDSMTEAYYYNLFGVAFYDFALEGLGGKKYTLSDEQVQEALQNAKPGENIKIDGLEYTVAPGKTEIIPNKNDSGRDTDFTNTTGTTETTTETDTNASVTAFKKGGEISKNVEVHFGKDNGIKAGVSEKESQEQSQQTTTTHSDSTSEQRKNETSKKTSIPKYTAAELEENNSTTTIKRDYEQTVFLTYKTAVFSMNGLYHGRDFDEGGFQQRTFFTQFGNDQDNTSAWSSLKARTDNETDRGFDAANGITRLFGKSRSRSFFWHYNTTNFTWDTPFLNSLRWDEIQNKMNVLGLNGPETIRQLTTQLPVASLTGTYSKQTCTKQIELKDFIPTRPLTNVFLKNSAQAAGTVNQSESFPLNAVELRGIIANGSEFYGFTASKGTWKPVDENGNPVNKCALGSVVKDQSGNMIFKAAANAKGTVRLKYFVNDNAYRIYAGPGATTPVDSAKVASPVITLNIQSDSDTFNGKIETPKEVSVTYTPGKAVDLTKVKGLQVNVFDAKGFQAEKPTKWDLKKSGGAKLDGNQLTVSEDGTYQIRAIYGNVFSDWTQIHAKAEQKPQQKTEQKAEQKAEQ
ncbi:MAG: hypothetical protein HUJ54_10475, partial [Erysipelotrichaceae bacterium]|nr:hypothetical protein [Erysipelotrichaceae bacterium]